MKHWVIVILSCLLIANTTPLRAQEQLLWQVAFPGKANHGWLMGTIHQFPEEVLQLDSSILLLLNEAQGLVLETELNWKMMARYLLAPGREGYAVSGGNMDANIRNALFDFFVNGGRLDEEKFDDALQPSVTQSLEALCYSTYGSPKKSGGMEELLRQAAIRFSKPVLGLDKNLKEINGWFDYYLALEVAQWETQSIDSMVATKFYAFSNLFSAYGIQDTALLHGTGNEDNYREGLSLVAWRNNNWMKQLPQLFDDGYFIAVGAAHLHGPNGVISLLRQAGCVLTPITTNFRGERFWRFLQRYSSIYELQ